MLPHIVQSWHMPRSTHSTHSMQYTLSADVRAAGPVGGCGLAPAVTTARDAGAAGSRCCSSNVARCEAHLCRRADPYGVAQHRERRGDDHRDSRYE